MVVSGAVAVEAVIVGIAKPSDQVWCPLPSEPRKDAVMVSGASKPAGMKYEISGSVVAVAAGEASAAVSDHRSGKRGCEHSQEPDSAERTTTAETSLENMTVVGSVLIEHRYVGRSCKRPYMFVGMVGGETRTHQKRKARIYVPARSHYPRDPEHDVESAAPGPARSS